MATDTISEKHLKREIKANNDPVDIEIRKHQNRIATIGTGIMIFGVWNLVKTIGYYDVRSGGMNTASFRESMISGAAIILISLLMRGYVGMSALAVSRGQDKGRLYLFLARWLMLASVLIIVVITVGMVDKFMHFLPAADTEEVTFMMLITSFIIEITSLILVLELIHSGKKLRKMAKEKKD